MHGLIFVSMAAWQLPMSPLLRQRTRSGGGRSCRMQLASASIASPAASSRLFEDQQLAMEKRAVNECKLLAPHCREMVARKMRSGSGGGFGAAKPKRNAGSKSAKTKPAKAQPAERRTAEMRKLLDREGVLLVPSAMRRETALELRACVLDEVDAYHEAVASDPTKSRSLFNVPVETHDPTRGYVLLPFHDRSSVARGCAGVDVPIVSAISELLGRGTTLGELTTCTRELPSTA